MDVLAERSGEESGRHDLIERASNATPVKHAPAGIWSIDEAEAIVRRLQADGKVVVVTNGVFDLLHPGHVR